MTLEALNSAPAPLHRHVSDVAGHISWTKRRRTKRVFKDDYFAECLIALAQIGGATSSSTAAAAVDAEKQTKISASTDAINSYNFALIRHKAAADDCASGAHECSICGKIFPSGQALGGHKRKHYGGVISRNYGGRKSRVSSSDGGTMSTDFTSVSDGNGGVDMAPIERNLDLKLPLPPSPCLDLTLIKL